MRKNKKLYLRTTKYHNINTTMDDYKAALGNQSLYERVFLTQLYIYHSESVFI